VAYYFGIYLDAKQMINFGGSAIKSLGLLEKGNWFKNVVFLATKILP
jgi:hypothetical protein